MGRSMAGSRMALDPRALRWAIAVDCALLGALMLLAPHQFAGPLWARLALWLPAVAVALLLASLGLFLAAVVPGRRRLVILAHLSAGVALSLFLYNAVAIGAWSAVPIYLP